MKRGGLLVAIFLGALPAAALAVAPAPPAPPSPSIDYFTWVEASYRCGQPSPLQFQQLDLPSQGLSILFDIHVDQHGSVESVVLTSSSGSSAFDQAAVQMVGEWRYRPKIQHARPSASQVRLRVDMLGEGRRISATAISTFDDRIEKLRLEPCK